jgi:hypothetical protein
MSKYVKTPVAARLLRTSYFRVINLVRFDRIKSPRRDSSGDYLWSKGDLARARTALNAAPRRSAAEAS